MITKFEKAKRLALLFLITITAYLWGTYQRTVTGMIFLRNLRNTHVSWNVLPTVSLRFRSKENADKFKPPPPNPIVPRYNYFLLPNFPLKTACDFWLELLIFLTHVFVSSRRFFCAPVWRSSYLWILSIRKVLNISKHRVIHKKIHVK